MNRIKNIAKLLILLTTILLLVGTRYAHAQNTGLNPYLDSEHSYAVKIGKAGNTKNWVVTDKDEGNSNTPYTINSGNEGLYTWFDIEPATTDGTNEIVNIFFDRDIFAPGETLIETWYLQYFEYQLQSDGTTECVAAREYKITVTENEFYITLNDNYSQCNGEDGATHTFSEVNTNTYPTTVNYKVVMNKESDYDPNQYRFNISFNQTPVPNSITATVTTENGGSANFTVSGTDSIITVNPAPGYDFPDTDTVNIAVTFNNNVLSETTPALTVSNGEATVNGTPPAITYDNEDIYPVGNPSDRTQAITIYELPATSDITHGAGETTTSAANPLQNSTHNYLVTMENESANTGTWSIENGSGTVMAEGTGTSDHYSLTPSITGNAFTAAISFTDNMPTGTYTIKFEEENTTGCSTVRAYEINLGEPLDIDLFVADAQCPYISGSINTPNTGTSTLIGDTVRIVSSGYTNNWEFDFEITSTPPFSSADVDITWVTLSAGGTLSDLSIGTTTTGTVSVTNSETSPVTSVVINVTYDGLYEKAHTINIELSNITGSFNEEDADATNSGTHTINALPQPGELAGVD